MPSKIESQIEGRVLPIAQEMKMDLVDVELRKEGQARFMRILQSLRETLLSPPNFSKQPTPDENNLYQGKP